MLVIAEHRRAKQRKYI